jgi:hypothetical protein
MGGIVPVGVGRVDTDRGTDGHWSRRAVARCRLLIGPRVSFKFKFDCWN